MSVLPSCQDVRNQFVIKEISCPKCKNETEVFIRDGKTLGTAKCETCGFVMVEGQQVSGIL